MTIPEFSEGARPVDPHSPMPRWAQIAADLRRRLAEGQFSGRFPTEGALLAEYSVSRSTVRQALRRLRDDGLLEARQGAGTFLADPDRSRSTPGISSLALTLRALGVEESNEVRVLDLRPAGEMAEPLGLEATDSVVHLERLRFGDDVPIALDRSWLPASLARPLLDADCSSGSLYALLALHCAVRVTGGREQIRPVAADEADRTLLQLPITEAILKLDRVALAGSIPVEVRHSRLRGDRYELLAAWGDR